MATRQYIGARYVPKFFDWDGSPEWRSGVEYEALTIVTRNGNSYTSKIPVPSNIGAPESNPTYWVATGLYNEQLETYRAEVQEVADRVEEVANDTAQDIADEASARTTADNALGDRIDDEVSARTSADINLNNNLTSLNNKLTSVINGSNRKYVFIGDSYLQGTVSYAAVACHILGASIGTNAWEFKNGGSGFVATGTGGLKFSDLLTTAHTQLSAVASDITDVIVCSGGNDRNESTLNIQTAITNFVNSCKSYFPNAYIHLSCIAGNQNWQDENLIISRVKQAIDSTNESMVNVITNGYVPMLNNGYYSNDAIHPNDEAKTQIGRLIGSAVLSRTNLGNFLPAIWTTNFSSWDPNVATHDGSMQFRLTKLGVYVMCNALNVTYTNDITVPFNAGAEFPIGTYSRGTYGMIGMNNGASFTGYYDFIPCTFYCLVGGSSFRMQTGYLSLVYDSASDGIKVSLVCRNGVPETFSAHGVYLRGLKQFISF